MPLYLQASGLATFLPGLGQGFEKQRVAPLVTALNMAAGFTQPNQHLKSALQNLNGLLLPLLLRARGNDINTACDYLP